MTGPRLEVLGSPRVRFWIGIFATPLVSLLVLLVAPRAHLAVRAIWLCLVAAWLTGLAWILSAHVTQAGGWARISVGRALLVSIGFTFAVVLVFSLSMAFLAFGRLAG